MSETTKVLRRTRNDYLTDPNDSLPAYENGHLGGWNDALDAVEAMDALCDSPAHALREYADLQDMVAASGGTFPVRLNGHYTSETLRRLADAMTARAGAK